MSNLRAVSPEDEQSALDAYAGRMALDTVWRGYTLPTPSTAPALKSGPYTFAEEQRVKHLWLGGYSDTAIAKALCRPYASINNFRYALGLRREHRFAR